MENDSLEYLKNLNDVSSDVMANYQQKMVKLPADLLELLLHQPILQSLSRFVSLKILLCG